ncbi:MAG: zinc-binding dehydrogenase [Gammaproteobacteria bacterium]|nr:zinc-binding dehydrogenase [Gammaproteobacteria bacterium]
MKVIEIRAPGGPQVLTAGERETPRPAPTQVLVQVKAAGVNGPDLVQRAGHYPPPKGASDLLGLEIAGTVAAVGSGVTSWRVGDHLCALTNGGGYAHYCAVNADHCLPIPGGLDFTAAASLPETFFTVWSNVFLPKRLPQGGVFLVHGGAGGIGSTAVQLGSALGARVFTTVADDAQAEFCHNLGAARTINFREEDFVSVVRDEAGGADCVLDIIAGEYFERNIKACRHDASIVQLAFNGGAKVTTSLMPIMLKRLTYTGSTLRSRSDEFKAQVANELREHIWPLFENGRLRPMVGQALALEQARAAHELMESTTHLGKIVLTV